MAGEAVRSSLPGRVECWGSLDIGSCCQKRGRSQVSCTELGKCRRRWQVKEAKHDSTEGRACLVLMVIASGILQTGLLSSLYYIFFYIPPSTTSAAEFLLGSIFGLRRKIKSQWMTSDMEHIPAEVQCLYYMPVCMLCCISPGITHLWGVRSQSLHIVLQFTSLQIALVWFCSCTDFLCTETNLLFSCWPKLGRRLMTALPVSLPLTASSLLPQPYPFSPRLVQLSN